MIEKITKELLEKFITEIKKDDNMKNIQINVIDPLIQHTFSQVYPYLLTTSIIFILLFIITLIILFFLLKISFKM